MVAPYSVVIPIFNGADTIKPAIASVLAQTVVPQAIIVVDDGSTDATASIVQALAGPISLLRQDNAGPGTATTRGMQQVKTPFLATLDADDLWLPSKIECQFAALAREPDTAAIFGRMASFRHDPAEADHAGGRDGWSRSTMLVRRDVAVATGAMLDPPGRVGEMIDWLARMRELGHRLSMLPEVVALRRIRPGSLTYGNGDLGRSYLHVARAALERRRLNAAPSKQS